MKLLLSNVRCFKGDHTIPVAPLTFLVGENSSGKSTVLTMLDAALSLALGDDEPTFNRAPYDLGQFRSIATYESETFGLGVTGGGDQDSAYGITATFRDDSGQPRLAERRTWTPQGELRVSVPVDSHELAVELRLQDGETISKKLSSRHAGVVSGPSSTPLLEFLRAFVRHELLPERLRTDREAFRKVMTITDPFGRWFDFERRQSPLGVTLPPLSLAPVRTKPRRTYDQALDTYSPEGDHIPLVLAKTLRRDVGKDTTMRLVRAIRRFGLDSGLFRNVRIKRLGRTAGDPFQVNIVVAGRPNNLADVGYGVSQCLPIVVQSILAEHRRTLLIQQPEVHLHPKAQAALGSLFVTLAAHDGKRFVIETHSDYLVDRARRSVGKGEIPASNVCLLFFGKQGQTTTVDRIQLDDKGSISATPEGYRRFFIDEELSFLLEDGEQLMLFKEGHGEGHAQLHDGSAPPRAGPLPPE